MDIATNSFLAALLLDASAAVKALQWPIEVPLDPSKAVRFSVKALGLRSREFQSKPWPVTLGQTHVAKAPPDPRVRPQRAGLTIAGVSPEYAVALIAWMLPQADTICSNLQFRVRTPIRLDDISLGESEIKLHRGRPMAKMVLNSGHTIYYYEGSIRAVHAPDRYLSSPAGQEAVRQSAEYKDPARFSQEEVVDRVRRLLIEGLGLSASELFLDTKPVFAMKPNPEAKDGVRRYGFSWQRPESDQEIQEREAKRIMAPASVAVEVDAVSGEIKSISFFHTSFQRPDPDLGVPMESPSKSSPESKPTDQQR
jgi:hypothetical protein